MRRGLATILVILLSMSMLAGCGGNGGTSSTPEGKYIATAFEVDGQDMLALYEELSAMMGEEAPPFEMYLELLAEGKCQIVFAGEDPEEATYTIDGKTITIESYGEELAGTIDGKKITLESEMEGSTMKMVFEKQ